MTINSSRAESVQDLHACLLSRKEAGRVQLEAEEIDVLDLYLRTCPGRQHQPVWFPRRTKEMWRRHRLLVAYDRTCV